MTHPLKSVIISSSDGIERTSSHGPFAQPMSSTANQGAQARRVAPPDQLRQDFAALEAGTLLRCTHEVEQILLMQSIEGHAHAGHGQFHGKTYPNTTVNDVARAIRFDPGAVKAERQELIDEIVDFIDRAIAGEDLHTASNELGEPLLRCSVLRFIPIEPKQVLRGFYMGGLRDSVGVRSLANERYGVTMGYGECRLVDQEVLRRLGLNGFDLARKAHEDDIGEFERAGLFSSEPDGHVAYMYVRHRVGPGASDDSAILMAGKMLGVSGAVGCFLADAIDTLEKYVPVYSDQDEEISEHIELNFKDLELTRDDAVDLAYLCAIPHEMQGDIPDSSLRHLLQVDRKVDQSAIESHLAHVAGRPYSGMVLDHGECTNLELYEYIDSRFAQFARKR